VGRHQRQMTVAHNGARSRRGCEAQVTSVSYQSPRDREAQRRAAEELQSLQQVAREQAALRLGGIRSDEDQQQVIADLARTVERSRRGSRRWAAAVTEYSALLLQRFRQLSSRDLGDLVTAIQLLSEAGNNSRMKGAAEAARLATLVECLEEWQVMAQLAPPEGWPVAPSHVPDLDAMRRRLAAMVAAPARHRIRMLHACARVRAANEGPAAGYDDMVAAVALLPRVAGWGLSRRNRAKQVLAREQMQSNTAVTSDAAACAIAAGRPVDAIELLETGRGVMWDRLLHATIRAELRAVDRRLARRVERACRDLEKHGRPREISDPYQARDIASRQSTWPDTPGTAVTRRWGLVNRLTQGRLTQGRLTRRERQWERATNRAQSLLPDATFQRAQYLSHIRPAAAEGPVVAVVLSRFGCHALLVTIDNDEPQVVNLPALTVQGAQHNARQYLTALNNLTGREREAQIQATLHWLWETIAEPVFAALALPAGEDGENPRLWWCPSGPLAVLPLHAATPRPHEDSDNAETDPRAVSSYTPTLRSLISARKARDLRNSGSASREQERMLLVSVGHRAGQQALPATARFRDFLTDLIPAHHLTTLHGPKATTKNVKRALGRHRRAHFDCHGRQDPDTPTRTGLVLYDRDLTIDDLGEVRIRRPEFAFLAACSTAAPDHQNIDEMISVTSVLYYRGYQSVIGTMSPVLDTSTERVATQIYQWLAETPSPSGSAAGLLHDAVSQERRRRSNHPSTWVPFIHVGI
jgi:CHAT domain-containing protein